VQQSFSNFAADISFHICFSGGAGTLICRLIEEPLPVKVTHLPALTPRYWTLIAIASILGANLGDFLSDVLGLGNLVGLPWLALALFVLFLLERIDKRTHTDLYYWVGVALVRASATNIGDYFQRDLHLEKPVTLAALFLLLLMILVLGRPVKEFWAWYQAHADGLKYPTADLRYWAAMLTAGTIGTVVGDYLSYGGYHIGNTWSSAILSAITAVVFLAGRKTLTFIPFYWLTIVSIRSAGTAVGDMLADPEKFMMGLKISTALSAVVYFAVILLWPRKCKVPENISLA